MEILNTDAEGWCSAALTYVGRYKQEVVDIATLTSAIIVSGSRASGISSRR